MLLIKSAWKFGARVIAIATKIKTYFFLAVIAFISISNDRSYPTKVTTNSKVSFRVRIRQPFHIFSLVTVIQ
ncbi:hypothetical protein MtrunA17_Chr7g0237231 [Medicago truncatula]|uniref:Transmembrane protein n=1 Tax=Medicago truncatula TaxID=3880 RepID=A0A396GXW5_MEDTR|nr:hypothetical protein MtrunA17_Chr7g0237231 [Medicago truncatula]